MSEGMIPDKKNLELVSDSYPSSVSDHWKTLPVQSEFRTSLSATADSQSGLDVVKSLVTANSVSTTKTFSVEATTPVAVLKQGIDTLIQLYRLFGQSVHTEGLKAFVDFYCEKMLSAVVIPPTSPEETRTTGSIVQVDSFSCPVCYGIFIEPVTIQCGHSYCRKCLHKESAGKSCRRCKYILTANDISWKKVNVLVNSLVEKWWPNYVSSTNFRNEGNLLFAQNEGDQALVKYTQAIDLCPDDHLSLGNRAQTLLTMGRSEEALTDAETAIKSCSVWAKGYFRKSVTLCSLGRYEEAFITLTVCLYLVKATEMNDETAVLPLKSELMKVLHKIFLQSTGRGSHNLVNTAYRRHSLDPGQYSPYVSPRAVLRRERKQFSGETESTSGDEIEKGKSILKSSRSVTSNLERMGCGKNLNQCPITSTEQYSIRIHRIFDRAIQETKRIQKEVIEKTKNVADQLVDSSISSRRSSVLRPVDKCRILVSDFECTLCYRLLYQPVTTSCGHTYCRSCLERSLDHSSACPLCKTSLQDLMTHHKPSTTYFIQTAMMEFLRDAMEDRFSQHKEEVEMTSTGPNREMEIPIFVCTIGFPTVPCPLHVFEPRYRLMIRRSMETGTRRFGMCSSSQDSENNYSDYGTLLEIKNVQYFADGRSVIDTVGAKRFKVMRRSQKDGYNTAVIEIINDHAVNPMDRAKLQHTHDQVYMEATSWLKSINQILRQRIQTHFGTMPSPEEEWMEQADGPSWAWWLLAILPLDTKAQLTILGMNNLQKRLESIFKVLTYIKSHQM